MITSVMRVGEAAAIALDELLLELSGLSIGDAVRVQWQEDGTLVVTPLGRAATPQELASSIRRVSKTVETEPAVPAADEPPL
jgi:antitoxin component of MazEF toxin-antitoxin module